MKLKAGIILFLAFVANAQDTGSSSLQSAGVLPIKTVEMPSAEMACGLLSYPGDIILQHEETFTEHRLGDNIILAAKIREIMTFNSPDIKYGHAEIITSVAKDSQNLSLVSWSFYPPRFQEHLPEDERKGPFIQFGYGENPIYRMNFSIYRVRPSILKSVTELREEALANIQHRTKDSVYGFRYLPVDPALADSSNKMEWQKIEFGTRLSVCSDFVAWAYSRHITSWWNRLPFASQIIATIYPFEAVTTPDSIAKSPDTQKVCEISNLGLKIPGGKVQTSELIKLSVPSLNSKNEEIKKHSQWVLQKLISEHIIDQNLQILVPEFAIKVVPRY
jgi:hypothetical protein